MKTTFEKFHLLGGGDGVLGDIGGCDLWHLTVGGLNVPLGARTAWALAVDPFPHAWRVTITLAGASVPIWFDVSEDAAMRIERLAG